MSFPEVDGLKTLGVIGWGESGQVFAAHDKEGRLVTLKVFESLAINRNLLSKAVDRLKDGSWPEGVAELVWSDFGGRPAYWVAPFYGVQIGEGDSAKWLPRSLQHQLDYEPGEENWHLVKEIAAALGGMHGRRVAHGNLKPGNVFLSAEGKVKLMDWTLGNMPGISSFDFTDALLYQAPEQLLDPLGFYDEAGYGWDVFAFGVLGYRLLTGEFPRCHEIFTTVIPEQGQTRREEISADASKVAESLLGEPAIKWPSDPVSPFEEGFRALLERCMHLRAADRPTSMVEVVKEFAEIEYEVEAKQTRERLVSQRARTVWSRRWIIGYAGLVTVVVLMFFLFWRQTTATLNLKRVERRAEKAGLLTDAVQAREARDLAVSEKLGAEEKMEREYNLGITRLKASRLVGDKLFDWAMKKGYRRLPALDDRELRLQQLESYYEDFLAKNSALEELSEEMARVRLQLAEISLSAGDAEQAELRLELALKEWSPEESDREMRLRLGRNRLLLALLKQERGAQNMGEAFQQARVALEAVGDAENPRLMQLLAILDFNEAKLLASEKQDTKALEQLLRATRVLNELSDLRPDAAVLRSELAECYLSSARILEGMGNLGDAREVRALAAKEMESLLSGDPGNSEIQLELAGAYGAMAEASLLSGDIVAVKSLSSDAMKLLNEVLQKQPESRIAKIRKAAQMGLQAGLLRDQGKADEALAMFEQGIAMLEREESGAMVDYRLALLRWQKGRMLGFSGEKAQEISLLEKANDSLRELEGRNDVVGLWRDALPRSRAYLLGDYAHALELAKQEEKSTEIYREATGLWEKLLKSRPNSEEYRSALEWTRERAEGGIKRVD